MNVLRSVPTGHDLQAEQNLDSDPPLVQPAETSVAAVAHNIHKLLHISTRISAPPVAG